VFPFAFSSLYNWDPTGARLLNIPEYQIVPILTYTILLYSFSTNRHHFTANIQLSNAMMLFKILLLALTECVFVSYFHFIIKSLAFLIFLCPVTGFPSELIVLNPFIQNLVQLH